MAEATEGQVTLVPQRVNIKTSDGTHITGEIHLEANQRITDLFMGSAEPFLVMLDAASTAGTGKTLILNKAHIVWIEVKD